MQESCPSKVVLYAIKMSDLVFITQDSLGLFWCSMDSLFEASPVDKGAGQLSCSNFR